MNFSSSPPLMHQASQPSTPHSHSHTHNHSININHNQHHNQHHNMNHSNHSHNQNHNNQHSMNHNHNQHHSLNNFQNSHNSLSNNDDPLNSIRQSLAGLSVGVGNVYNPPAQRQEYVPGTGSQAVAINQSHSVSVAPGPGGTGNSQSQLSSIIGGGGEPLSWGSSANGSGLIRQQSSSSTVAHSHQQQYNANEQYNTSTNINTNEQRKRGESIDKFLSRSPSQSLGTEFLKLRNEESSRTIPPLSLDLNNSQPSTNPIGMVGQQHGSFNSNTNTNGNSNNNSSSNNHIPGHSRQSSYSEGAHVMETNAKPRHGKESSPTCSVTGTSASSRSVSPSWNPNLHDGMRRGSIPASVGMAHTINQYQQGSTSVSSMSNLGGGATATAGASAGGARVHYNQELNSSYESFSSNQIFSGNSNSYESFHGQGGAVNTSFNLTSNGLDTSRDNYHSHSLNNSSHNLGSTGREDHQFSRQPVMSQGYNSHPHMSDNSILKQAAQQPPPPKETKPQQQVFYVAVPTEDGQGQVLQPIQMQMVQIPGQPNAFVLPAAAHASNIVGVSSMPQGAPMSLTGSVGNLQNTQAHAERKSYNHMQGSRHQLDMSNGQYIEDNFGQGYADESSNYGDKHFRPARGHVERRESVPNATSDIVANLYASPQRPPLRELLGHVRRLSRDQVGCRLLQQALDEEGASAASMILKEGLSFWGEAMVDPFGNYLFQKILEKITADERIILVQNVSPRLVNASLNLHGTRSVQKVVELCAIDEKESSNNNNADDQKQETASEILTRSLTPAAARLCIDSHGNHVIQRILLKLPYQYSHFVFDAVANSVGDVARHRHGCCVIQRCLDSPPSTARSNLVRRIVEKSLELMQDAYGNYVVQYVLDVCSDEDVHAVCESVVGKVTLLAIQKFSSNVMEKCLERCTDKVRELYLTELSDSERIRELMMDPFGNYVIQRALAVSTHAQAVQLVEAMKPHLFSSTGGGIKNTAGGRRILAKISKRFPNFSLGDEFGESPTTNPVQKNNHKKNGNGRHDNNLPGDQTSARFNRRGQGKSDEPSDQHKRPDNSRYGRSEENIGQWDRVQS